MTDIRPEELEDITVHDTLLPEFFAYTFDRTGAGQPVDLKDLQSIKRDDHALVWVHFHLSNRAAIDWLTDAGLDSVIIDALTDNETRPRCTVHGDGAFLNLRGVNLNPGSEPEDMVSVRFWIEGNRVIGVWLRPLMAIRDLLGSVERRQGPLSAGDLIARIALRLVDKAEPVVASLNERLDSLEEMDVDDPPEDARRRLSAIRRESIRLRRYMLPQRDALSTLEIEDFDWLPHSDRVRIREAVEHVVRLGEELDAIRDRAQVVRDELVDRRSEAMNRQMLVLSVVAAVFLPLTLIAGVLGMNVGGVPGADSAWGFVSVCGFLVAFAAVLIWYFRRIGLLRRF
ncbi:MAG: zinc transporter ZntB [Alphaproteobacteria bacterium]